MSTLTLPATHSEADVSRRCPACDGARFVERHITAGLRTHTCQSCGLVVSTITRRKPAVGQYENVDLRAYLTSVGALRAEQSSSILSLLGPHLPPGARVLDVGCGFGSFLIRARDAGYVVAGIEPDAQAAAGACAALGHGIVRQGTLQEVRPASGSADVVATLDVLEHVPPAEHAGFARAVTEVLAPGGVWVIKIPSTEGLYYRASALVARVDKARGAPLMRRLWQTDYQFPHAVYFDRRSLQRWLHRHGFTMVEHRYLPELPIRTVIDRLTHDGDISRPQAYVLAPAVALINSLEWLRRRSDALVVLARRRAEP